ncbi:MAG TPA: HAD-IA family hydrolase [Steroidobacteraceae bacterium]|nr:HAD-IA family hydrolase [Steroidobacteraceae bacterium]
MRGLQALIFDVDGTLADTEELHREAFNTAFRSFDLPWNWDAALYGRLLQVTGGKERIARYIDELPILESERARLKGRVPDLHAAKTRFYRQLIGLGRVRPRAGVRRLMLEALEAGVRLGIASTTSPENVEPLIRAAFGQATLSWFATIATGDIVQHKKPAPDIYNVAVAELTVPASGAVAVEDSAIGVESAKRAGLFAVAVPCRWTRTQDFSSADLVLDSLGEPDHPLDEASARRLGARYLSLEHLAALHGASLSDRRRGDGRST